MDKPPKLTMLLRKARNDRIKAEAIHLISIGRSITAVAETLGVTRESLYEWRAHDEAFMLAWESAYDQRVNFVEDVAFDRAAAGSDTMLMFLLRGGKPGRYGDKRQIDINQHSNLDVRVLRSLPIDELLSRLTMLRDAQRGLEIDGNVVDLDERREAAQVTDKPE